MANDKQKTPEQAKAEQEAKLDALTPKEQIDAALKSATEKGSTPEEVAAATQPPPQVTTAPPSPHDPASGIQPRQRVAEQEAVDAGEEEGSENLVVMERVQVNCMRMNGETITTECFAHEIPILQAINRRERVQVLPPDPKLGRAEVNVPNSAEQEYKRMQNVYNNKRQPNIVETVYPNVAMLAEASGLPITDDYGTETRALVKRNVPKAKGRVVKGKASR